jgi:hypothetical protein
LGGFFENCAVYYMMLNNMVEPDGTQMTMRLMRIARWITKATDTHSEYSILIGFARQQMLTH